MRSFTLRELADQVGAELIGDPHLRITGVNGLELATGEELSFLANPNYVNAMRRSKAGAVVMAPGVQPAPRRNFLICEEPAEAFDQLLHLFHPDQASRTAFPAIHSTAIIDESAQIGEGVWIGPYAVVDRGAKIGAGSRIGPHVYVGPDVEMGERCQIDPHVTLHAGCQLGNRVVILSGAVVGCTGFGFITNRKGCHKRLTHIARVVIEDDVEIGPLSTIDQGHFAETRIRRGSKIDGMVRIAHGVEVGEDNLIVGQSGIAGSSKTGRHVILAGQVGIKDHVTLADGVICAARSGVMKSLTEAGKYAGEPATLVSELGPVMLAMRRLPHHVERIARLEERLAALEAERE